MYDPDDYVFCFRMVMITRHEAGESGSRSGSGSGSGSGVGRVDEGLHEFIASKITIGILKSTLVIFWSIKEGIMELMEDRLKAFRSDMASSQSGLCTLSFKDFRGRDAPDFHGVKEPIVAMREIADMEFA